MGRTVSRTVDQSSSTQEAVRPKLSDLVLRKPLNHALKDRASHRLHSSRWWNMAGVWGTAL